MSTALKNSVQIHSKEIHELDLITLACLVTWPLNESDTRVDLVMIQSFLVLLC